MAQWLVYFDLQYRHDSNLLLKLTFSCLRHTGNKQKLLTNSCTPLTLQHTTCQRLILPILQCNIHTACKLLIHSPSIFSQLAERSASSFDVYVVLKSACFYEMIQLLDKLPSLSVNKMLLFYIHPPHTSTINSSQSLQTFDAAILLSISKKGVQNTAILHRARLKLNFMSNNGLTLSTQPGNTM